VLYRPRFAPADRVVPAAYRNPALERAPLLARILNRLWAPAIGAPRTRCGLPKMFCVNPADACRSPLSGPSGILPTMPRFGTSGVTVGEPKQRREIVMADIRRTAEYMPGDCWIAAKLASWADRRKLMQESRIVAGDQR
jgi:hypothetical protein